jgi:hypothetical protein
VKELQDALAALRDELAQSPVGRFRELNAPGHDVSLRL